MVVNSAISSPYFYKLINLIGSIHKNAPSVSKIVVWDIGLNLLDRLFLKIIKNVYIEKVPAFVEHWREGYSWKIYVYKNCPEKCVFNIDAGSIVLSDLHIIEEIINKDGFFCVGQGLELYKQTPEDYWDIFDVDKNQFKEDVVFHAGIFGFKRNELNNEMINYTYDMILNKYSLGFSKIEQYRHKKTCQKYIRNCELFRQDQTVLNLAYRKFFGKPKILDVDKFACTCKEPMVDTVIYNHRYVRYSEISMINYKKPIYKIFGMMLFLISHPKRFKHFLFK